MPNSRTNDFRYVFSNTFRIQFTPNEMTVGFAISEDPLNANDSLLEQVAVIITPSGAKLLGRLLSTTIADYERETGTVVPIPNGSFESIDKIVRDGKVVVSQPPAKKR
jgi:hypothetical protein